MFSHHSASPTPTLPAAPTATAPGPSQTCTLRIHGKVQGVYYRQSTVEKAQQLGLQGWVRNRTDGSVEALISGPEAQVQALIAWAHSGPPAAHVTGVDITPTPTTTGETLDGFAQRPTL